MIPTTDLNCQGVIKAHLTQKEDQEIHCLSFSLDGDYIAIGLQDGSVKV